LDKLEGYPHLYNRRKINTDWIVYEMNDKSRTSPPNGGYYKMIEDGYKDLALMIIVYALRCLKLRR